MVLAHSKPALQACRCTQASRLRSSLAWISWGVGSTLRYFEAGALSRPGVTVSAALRDLAPLNNTSPHISQVSRCGGWVRAGGWFRTWPARVPAAVGGWAGSTMVSLVAGLVESRSQAAAALRNRA